MLSYKKLPPNVITQKLNPQLFLLPKGCVPNFPTEEAIPVSVSTLVLPPAVDSKIIMPISVISKVTISMFKIKLIISIIHLAVWQEEDFVSIQVVKVPSSKKIRLSM